MTSDLLVRTFRDPDELAAAIRHSTIERTILQPGNFVAKFHRIELQELWLQHCMEKLPRTAHVYTGPGRIGIGFRTSPGPAITRRGIEIDSTDTVIYVRPGESFYHVLAGEASYAGMHLPVAEFNALGEVMLDRDPETLSELLKPPADAISRVQRLHAAVRNLAEDAPAVLAHSEGVRGIKQALIQSMMDCLNEGTADDDKAARRRHDTIMRRFHRAVEQHTDEALYVAELCREVGTSLRTLNACCHEHLGMGPKRYLLLRRMNLLHRTLSASSRTETTVTDAATRYGFWQFGRLAVEYKALFGEPPSATLARPVAGTASRETGRGARVC